VKGSTTDTVKIIALNKKARFNYTLVEAFEAGIVLTGAEIKSIRQGGVSINESYISPYNGELYLVNSHIKPYAFNADSKYDPVRRRKLLMHKREITQLISNVEAKGFTLVPTKIYLKKGRAKIELALAKGKDHADKRESTKQREANREAERAIKQQRR
jgi:SsrA-binding protein